MTETIFNEKKKKRKGEKAKEAALPRIKLRTSNVPGHIVIIFYSKPFPQNFCQQTLFKLIKPY